MLLLASTHTQSLFGSSSFQESGQGSLASADGPGIVSGSTMYYGTSPSPSDINYHSHQNAIPSNQDFVASSADSLIGSTTTIGYATVTINGLVGINATDAYSITAERSFLLPFGVQILMCLLYGTLTFTAVASNMIVCYIVLSCQRMRTATNYFIVNLAVGDILMALLCIPFTFPANLIFQYWPFGLTLCVVVSYSQANSVFISAYTMVAISIDKYIAIIYPMRPRILKIQAKIIILVIWSAAILTSLPTALLSNLSVATIDLTAGPVESTTTFKPPVSNSRVTPTTIGYESTTRTNNLEISSIPNLKRPPESLEVSRKGPSQVDMSEIQISTTNSSKEAFSTVNDVAPESSIPDPYQEQIKYACQESWTFWPKGKYYYSMALMLLQFVVPLLVLVITYTRIVVIVWGKRMPGEEDDARDARMARSKRKMIKMVISCVIAFALTWLPFNALIVIGDLNPHIWERQDIMYIWFITHYLAMCHTITNPLIYIWMNNRFRSGFKQVIGDIYRATKQVVVFIWCYCCCLGCCMLNSRRKYVQYSVRLRSRRAHRSTGTGIGGGSLRGAPGGTGTHTYQQGQQQQHQQDHSRQNNDKSTFIKSREFASSFPPTANLLMTSNSNNNNNNTTMMTTTTTRTGTETEITGNPLLSSSTGRKSSFVCWSLAKRGVSGRSTAPVSHQLLTTSCCCTTTNNNNENNIELASKTTPSSQTSDSYHTAPAELDTEVGVTSSPEPGPSDRLLATSGCRQQPKRGSSGERSNETSIQGLHQNKVDNSNQIPISKSDGHAHKNTGKRPKFAWLTSAGAILSSKPAKAKPKRGRAHRKQNSHVISIQMTSTQQFRQVRPEFAGTISTAGSGWLSSQRAHDEPAINQTPAATLNGDGGLKLSLGAPLTPSSADEGLSREQGCRMAPNGQSQSRGVEGKPNKVAKRGPPLSSKQFVVDMRQSSQSTATISMLTSTTSLGLSPLSSIQVNIEPSLNCSAMSSGTGASRSEPVGGAARVSETRIDGARTGSSAPNVAGAEVRRPSRGPTCGAASVLEQHRTSTSGRACRSGEDRWAESHRNHRTSLDGRNRGRLSTVSLDDSPCLESSGRASLNAARAPTSKVDSLRLPLNEMVTDSPRADKAASETVRLLSRDNFDQDTGDDDEIFGDDDDGDASGAVDEIVDSQTEFMIDDGNGWIQNDAELDVYLDDGTRRNSFHELKRASYSAEEGQNGSTEDESEGMEDDGELIDPECDSNEDESASIATPRSEQLEMADLREQSGLKLIGLASGKPAEPIQVLASRFSSSSICSRPIESRLRSIWARKYLSHSNLFGRLNWSEVNWATRVDRSSPPLGAESSATFAADDQSRYLTSPSDSRWTNAEKGRHFNCGQRVAANGRVELHRDSAKLSGLPRGSLSSGKKIIQNPTSSSVQPQRRNQQQGILSRPSSQTTSSCAALMVRRSPTVYLINKEPQV